MDPRTIRSALLIGLFLLHFGPQPSQAQTQDAVSREVSVFNLGLPTATYEAISREVSVFILGLPSAATEAVSREVSIFNPGLPSAAIEAISSEVSVFNFCLPSARMEAIGREVSVFNYGVPPVVLSIGSTNILGDETNRAPLRLQTVLDLTNVSLTLLTDDSHLEVLGVTPASLEVISVTLGTPSAGGHPIGFTLDPAAIPLTNHTLAYLGFRGKTNLESAIVPLTVSNLVAERASGQTVPSAVTNGRVIVVVTKPIVFPAASLPFGFTMYGIPGATYSIQATTNLAPPVWVEVQNLWETGPTLTVTGLTNRGPQQFYRAQQVGP